MKKNEIKLVILETIAFLILLFDIFLKKILDEYTIVIFLGIIFAISIFFVGFERGKFANKRSVIKIVTFYSLAFLTFMYGIGLFIGYTKTAYSLTLISIMKNIFPVILLIVISELLRFNILHKGNRHIVIFILSILLFAAIDVSLLIHLYNLNDLSKVLELSTVVIIPSIAKNIMLSDFSFKYGYESCIIYQLVMNLYLYLFPIIPSYGIYLDSVLAFLIPLLTMFTVNSSFQKQQREDIRDKHIPSKIITGLLATFIAMIIALCSNLFPYWIAVVGSGSMTPTINVGDAVIVNKSYKKNLEKLKVGDILVFQIKDVIYTHRIIDIKEQNGRYSISTKGDRKGQADDAWRVTNEDVVGVVKHKIPFIGYPTVWLNRILEGRKNEK